GRRDIGEALLIRGIEEIAGAHESESAEQRQLVVFQKKHAHAVRQGELNRLRWLDFRQRRILQFLISWNLALGLSEGPGCKSDCGGQCDYSESTSHLGPPAFAPAAAGGA